MTNPTHALIAPDGQIQFVFPDGYDIDTLVELDETHWDTPKVWDGSAFVEDIASGIAALWEKVKQKKSLIEEAGCVTALGVVDSDPVSQLKLNGAVTMALIAQSTSQPFSVDWTMADNSVVPHGVADIIGAGMAVGTHIATCHAVATALREIIEAATDFATLDVIDIDAAPWPANS